MIDMVKGEDIATQIVLVESAQLEKVCVNPIRNTMMDVRSAYEEMIQMLPSSKLEDSDGELVDSELDG
jgi:hypothetical protein